MQLKLYNSLSRTKEIFTPINPNNVRMYVCGPTVYDYPHIGNALAVVIYDVLFRVLKHLYKEEHVVYVRNITDVDDKIIKAAQEKNVSIEQLTKHITQIFHQNIEQIGCLKPNFEPKATEHIAEMVDIITKLIDGGFAYENNGDIFFRVHKFSDYGKLSGRNFEELIAGARVEIDKDKENPEDFVLWKSAKDEFGSFDSPFGEGRPGWHIECSAMSEKYLGSSFDIHGGGVDLIFPHHTNEIAQSCCANPGSTYARCWVHNGFLTVNGEKMSKSLGNFVTIDELLNKGINGEVIRYVLLASHYRKPVDWNDKALHDAKKALDSFYRVIKQYDAFDDVSTDITDFINTLLDDLNTPQSFAIMHEYVKQFNKENNEILKKEIAYRLKLCGNFLGFLMQNPHDWFIDSKLNFRLIEQKIQERLIAKNAQQWHLADQIRDELKQLNVVLEDKDGKTYWRVGS